MTYSRNSSAGLQSSRFQTVVSWTAILLVACVALLPAACGNSDSTSTPDPVSIQALYSSAVADARFLTPDEISNNLTPIVNYNGNLIWENGVVGSRLLVATVMNDNGRFYLCDDPAGCAGDTCKEGGNCPSYRWDSWVTVAPEMKNCFALSPPSLLRVVQLLGLPPSYATAGDPREAKYVLELWAAPKDLFRPCADSEISDTACEMDFPSDPFRMLDTGNKVWATEGLSLPVFKTYSSWFNNRTRNVYTATAAVDAYPWTRAGYTYDWGSSQHTGLSEFVLHGKKADASTISVGIHSVKTITEYFQP